MSWLHTRSKLPSANGSSNPDPTNVLMAFVDRRMVLVDVEADGVSSGNSDADRAERVADVEDAQPPRGEAGLADLEHMGVAAEQVERLAPQRLHYTTLVGGLSGSATSPQQDHTSSGAPTRDWSSALNSGL